MGSARRLLKGNTVHVEIAACKGSCDMNAKVFPNHGASWIITAMLGWGMRRVQDIAKGCDWPQEQLTYTHKFTTCILI